MYKFIDKNKCTKSNFVVYPTLVSNNVFQIDERNPCFLAPSHVQNVALRFRSRYYEMHLIILLRVERLN